MCDQEAQTTGGRSDKDWKALEARVQVNPGLQ